MLCGLKEILGTRMDLGWSFDLPIQVRVTRLGVVGLYPG